MRKLKRVLPKALYIMGWITILLAPARFAPIFIIQNRGVLVQMTDWLNYIVAAISTCGTGLLYMAAARAGELLEQAGGHETF